MCKDAADMISSVFDDYVCHMCDAKRLSNRGRLSGGIIVALKKSVSTCFERIHKDWENGIYFRVKNFPLPQNLIICFLYVQPENSQMYQLTEENGIDFLKNKILQISHEYEDCTFILCGDFNSRTANEPDFILDDNTDYLPLSHDYMSDDFDCVRHSSDTVTNNYGRLLLDICKEFGVHIVNGRMRSDIPSNFTFISRSGCSTIDYFIVSSSLFSFISDMAVLSRT